MGRRKRLKSLAFVAKVTRRDLPVTLHHRRRAAHVNVLNIVVG